jgi:SAM-dependent methyltransferase
MAGLYAEPMAVSGPEECDFYHTLELPISGLHHGQWDLRGRFDDYTLGVPLAGKTVLDVGTASGFLSFEAEKRGATVVGVDALSAAQWERLPFAQSLWFRDRPAWDASHTEYLDSIKRSYWLAHRELESRACVYYGDAYDLPESLGSYDVVIVGQILVHLRDVIRALTSVSRRCVDTLIIAEGMILSDEPTSVLLGRAEVPEQNHSFWFHSVGLYREVLGMLDFRLIAEETLTYTCNVPGNAEQTPITTLVFRRAGPDVLEVGPMEREVVAPAFEPPHGIGALRRKVKRRLGI